MQFFAPKPCAELPKSEVWARTNLTKSVGDEAMSKMPEEGETPSTAASVDRCPWNWRQVEVLCAVGAALTASSENGDKETADLFRATALEYGRRAKQMEASGKWVPGRAGDPVVDESIKWRCRQSAGEGPAGKAIWERYTEVRREVVNHILPIMKKYLSSDGSLPKDRDWASVLKATKNDYWKARRGAPAAKKDRPLPLDWNPPAWTVFVEYGPAGEDVPQLQEDSISGPGRKKRKSLPTANGKDPADAPSSSVAPSALGAMDGGDPWQGVKTRHGFKADEVGRRLDAYNIPPRTQTDLLSLPSLLHGASMCLGIVW